MGPAFSPCTTRQCGAIVVRWTGRPVRTRGVTAKHISSLLHQPVRQPTDAVAGMRGTDWGRRQSLRGDPLGGFAVCGSADQGGEKRRAVMMYSSV
jgi:hypothetical protein